MRVNRGAPQIREKREKREKCFVQQRGSRQLGWVGRFSKCFGAYKCEEKKEKKKFKFTIYLSVKITFNRCE